MKSKVVKELWWEGTDLHMVVEPNEKLVLKNAWASDVTTKVEGDGLKIEKVECEFKPKFVGYNGCKIEVDGRQIGKITEWTVGSVRDLDIYELKQPPVDFIPPTGAFTIELTRVCKKITDTV